MIIDAHTHYLNAGGITSVEPANFDPQPGHLYSVGIHPWHTQDVSNDTLQLLEQYARHPQVVAIGETGMDTLRGAPLDRQTELFEHHLQLAGRLGKPVVIHCVRTSQQVLAACRRLGVTVPRAIHGMRSNERVARPLIDAGFYLSFGPLFNPATVLATPRDRLLIETDDSGQSIAQVAAAIAPTLGLTAPSLQALATANLHHFLNCSS
ncbi:MAG: TatD family hydrolase [Muribaculaceae bacterium]|nr:TatD family hydrolase [Muribaculaceae bacterium]